MQFKGFYSDIIIPSGSEATVTLLSDRLMIEIPERNITREWFYGMIRKRKQKRDVLVLGYKNPTKGKLTITDSQFMAEVKRLAPYAPFTQHVPWYSYNNGIYSMFAVKIGTLVIAVLMFFFFVPVVVNFAVDSISKKTENSIGRKIYRMQVNSDAIDTLQTRLVNEIFSHLTGQKKDSVHIVVITSDIKNAFALPGNYIVVESGILSTMNDYPELVAVLGHESGHVANRHPLKMLCRQSATSILILSAMGNVNGVIKSVTDNAAYLDNLSYSRDYETEADHYAYNYMKENRINPQGMIDLLEHLEKEAPSISNVEFISNHPTIENRAKNIRRWMNSDKTMEYKTDPELEKIWLQLKATLPAEDDKK